jgi:O-acetylhomoserine/O-acetylserine sulfhydrylase-like pyridoxal-dependent enzyme
MRSGVRELALGSPGNLTIKVPSPALKRENMRSRMTKGCTGLSRNCDERFFICYQKLGMQHQSEKKGGIAMTEEFKGFETQAIHAGHTPDRETNSRAVPLYQTTSYTFDDSAHAADLFGLRKFGNIYTRIMNPTTDVLEQRVAALEGGVAALAVASGQAAETLTVLTLAKVGDEIVSSTDLYGGTVSLFTHTLSNMGIKVKFVPPNDLQAWENAVNEKTKAFFVESIGNPKLELIDIEGIAATGRKYGIPWWWTIPSPHPTCSTPSPTEQPS